MIKKFIQRMFGKGGEAAVVEPVIPVGVRVEVPVTEHHIDPRLSTRTRCAWSRR